MSADAYEYDWSKKKEKKIIRYEYFFLISRKGNIIPTSKKNYFQLITKNYVLVDSYNVHEVSDFDLPYHDGLRPYFIHV